MESNIYKQLRLEINKNSLGSILQLIDITYGVNKKIYFYNIPNELPNVKLSFTNVYNIKNCATKSCKTCYYYSAGHDVCTFKAIKKPRTDKRKNVGKVAEALINNPNKTVREIAKETWIGTSTVQRAKVEVAQTGTKDETIAYIVDKSKERIKTAQAIFDRYIQESSQKET